MSLGNLQFNPTDQPENLQKVNPPRPKTAAHEHTSSNTSRTVKRLEFLVGSSAGQVRRASGARSGLPHGTLSQDHSRGRGMRPIVGTFSEPLESVVLSRVHFSVAAETATRRWLLIGPLRSGSSGWTGTASAPRPVVLVAGRRGRRVRLRRSARRRVPAAGRGALGQHLLDHAAVALLHQWCGAAAPVAGVGWSACSRPASRRPRLRARRWSGLSPSPLTCPRCSAASTGRTSPRTRVRPGT